MSPVNGPFNSCGVRLSQVPINIPDATFGIIKSVFLLEKWNQFRILRHLGPIETDTELRVTIIQSCPV